MTVLIAAYVTDGPYGEDRLKSSPIEQVTSGQTDYSFWQVLKEPTVWKSTAMFFICNIAGWGFKSWLRPTSSAPGI